MSDTTHIVHSASRRANRIYLKAARQMAREGWNRDRSPSRLGRAGERAEQVNSIVKPAAASIVALGGAALILLDVWERVRSLQERKRERAEES